MTRDVYIYIAYRHSYIHTQHTSVVYIFLLDPYLFSDLFSYVYTHLIHIYNTETFFAASFGWIGHVIYTYARRLYRLAIAYLLPYPPTVRHWLYIGPITRLDVYIYVDIYTVHPSFPNIYDVDSHAPAPVPVPDFLLRSFFPPISLFPVFAGLYSFLVSSSVMEPIHYLISRALDARLHHRFLAAWSQLTTRTLLTWTSKTLLMCSPQTLHPNWSPKSPDQWSGGEGRSPLHPSPGRHCRQELLTATTRTLLTP